LRNLFLNQEVSKFIILKYNDHSQFCIVGSDRPSIRDINIFVVPAVYGFQYSISLQLFGVNNRYRPIKVDNDKNPEEKCTEMFDQWLLTERKATWDKVIAALRAVNLYSTADEVERMLDHRVSALYSYQSLVTHTVHPHAG